MESICAVSGDLPACRTVTDSLQCTLASICTSNLPQALGSLGSTQTLRGSKSTQPSVATRMQQFPSLSTLWQCPHVVYSIHSNECCCHLFTTCVLAMCATQSFFVRLHLYAHYSLARVAVDVVNCTSCFLLAAPLPMWCAKHHDTHRVLVSAHHTLLRLVSLHIDSSCIAHIVCVVSC